MQIAQTVLLPLNPLTVDERLHVVYTPVYTAPYVHPKDKIPAQLVLVLVTRKTRLGFMFYKETKRMFAVSTFFEDQAFWSQVTEMGGRIRRELPWAAKFFFASLQKIRKNREEMLTVSHAHQS